MKLTLGLGLVLAASSAALTAAEDKKDTKPTPEKAGYTAGPYTAIRTEKNIELTGSHIKQTVRRNGRITDGAGHVVVLDATTISRSGAGDVKELLAREGFNR